MTAVDGTLTPREVEQALGLSAPTVRRAAVAYEGVFGPLPRLRGQDGPRQWPGEAVRRVQVAHAALDSGRVTSMEHALRLIYDGQDLPTRPDLPARPDPIREMAATVEALRLEVAALREQVAAAPARELPAPGPSAEQVREIIRDEIGAALAHRSPVEQHLGDADGVRLAVREELEGLRVRLHAAAPPAAPAPHRGLLARLLSRLG